MSCWTGIRASRLLETERAKPMRMEERLRERVVGQDLALQTISEAVRRKQLLVGSSSTNSRGRPPYVFNVLLQILDGGRLTDGHGRMVDFK